MLLTLKEDNTTDNFYLCCLPHGLRVIMKSDALCTSVCLYTILICTDGMVVYVCPCILLTTACAVDYWLHGHQLQHIYI